MNFHSVSRAKSCRKAKRCEWCREMIAVGEPKVSIAAVWEGDFFTRHLHPECYGAQERWMDLTYTIHDYEWEYPDRIMPRGGCGEVQP